MTIENVTDRTLEPFNRGIFPAPQEFTDEEIAAIAAVPGIDTKGTFADAPMEQALLREYDLAAERGENTWPAFADVLREEKAGYFERIPSRWKEQALDQLSAALENCISLGACSERMRELIWTA